MTLLNARAPAITLPVVDETPIVFKTSSPTITQTHDINAYTAARVVTWPDAALTVAGLQVANTFTVAQTIDGSTDTPQLIVKQHSTQDEDAFRIVQDNGTKVLGIRYRAGYCFFNTDVQNDNYWFEEGFSVSQGANILNVNSGGGIGFETGGHLKFVSTSGQSYVKFREDTRSFGVGGNFIPSATIHGIVDDAATGAITNVAILGHNSSDTPAVNYGTGLLFQGKSSTDADQNMARLAALWDVATHASRSAALRVLISGSGGEVDAAKFDDDATAGNTRLLLYDVDNGQLERVSVGIADSGGIGFKLLRIAN